MDYHFLTFYLFYRNRFGRTVRILLFVILVAVTVLSLQLGIRPQYTVFLLNLLLMLEVFYRYKVSTTQSKHLIAEVDEKEALEAATLPAMAALHNSQTTHQTVQRLLTFPQVRFFMERCGIVESELPKSDMGNAILPKFAYKLAKQLGGRRITTMDLFAAYLLLEEEQAKLLFGKKLKDTDILQILRWTRMNYPYEEEVRTFRITMHGAGLGEFLVTGWTPETQQYTRSFTNSLSEVETSIVGKETEYRFLIETLLKPENNNVVLVGEAGVGKEQLIKHLAAQSYTGATENTLRYKTILELLVGSLLAGATAQGDLEARVKAIIDEVSHAENVILYVPEFQDLIGAGSFSLDLSGALAPYLKTGKLPVIASITSGNFKTYMERSPINELFSPIRLEEPKADIAEQIVMEKTQELETKQRVIISYLALKTAVAYADRYAQNAALPGSAISLLSDAISSTLHAKEAAFGTTGKVLITGDKIIQIVEQKTKISLAEPNREEKDLLLHLEDILHKRVIGQDSAIRAIAEAMRRIRSGVEVVEHPVSFLFLGPTGVGKTETAKALATSYFGGEQTMIRLDMSEYADEAGQRRLLGALPGQGEERGELTEKVRDHPYSLILLDEFEKAHPTILNLFLQILDDGRVTDNKGKTVSFMNTIIIATSNAASDYIHNAVEQGTQIDQQFERGLLEYLQSQRIFKPELLNRFDAVVTFKPLSEQEIVSVTKLLLQELEKHLAEKDITLIADETVLQKASHDAYNKEFGARPIRRYLQDTIEDLISQKILKGEIERGQRVMLKVAGSDFVLEKV